MEGSTNGNGSRDSPPALLTQEEALKRLEDIGISITRQTLKSWCERRGWGHRTPSGRWMVLRTVLEEYADAANEAARRAVGEDPGA